MSMAEVSSGPPEQLRNPPTVFLSPVKERNPDVGPQGAAGINEIRQELADHERQAGDLRSWLDKLEAPLPG